MHERHAILHRYVASLAPLLLGAAATEATASLVPLALGAAATLIGTVDVVRRIRARARRARQR